MMTQTAGLTEELFRRGTLMHLHVRRWSGIKKMRKEDLLLDDANEEALYFGHKRLLPKRALEKLVQIEGRARVAFMAASLEFPLPGIRYVGFHVLNALLDRLRPLQTEYAQEAGSMLDTYPRLMEEQLAALDAEAVKLYERELRQRPTEAELLASWLEVQRRQNRSFYPTLEWLRPRFGISWRMFTIQALEAGTQTVELDPSEVLEARNQLRQELSGWVREAAADMHRQLGAAAANARALLERHGRLDPRNLRPLFAAFESFEAMDFTGTSEFRTVIQAMRERVLVQDAQGALDARATSERLNDVQARREMDQLLSTIGSLAVEDVAEAAGVRALAGVREFGRVLDLSDE